jgi:hypothetical protein
MHGCTRRSDEESGGEIDWDNLGFGLTPTDYMYVMRSSPEDLGAFPRGELCRYGNIELSPSSGVLNYAQVRLRSSPPRTLLARHRRHFLIDPCHASNHLPACCRGCSRG